MAQAYRKSQEGAKIPRDSNGNYTLPAGNPVITGEVISTSWANPTMSDIGAELTNSLDRQGRGGMLAPFKFADGTLLAPSMTFTSEPTSGFYRSGASDVRIGIAGVGRMRWTSTGVDVYDQVAGTWLALTSTGGANFAFLDAANTFLASNTFAAASRPLSVQGLAPTLTLYNTVSVVNNGRYDIFADTSSFKMRLLTDALAAQDFFTVVRSGQTATSITLAGTAITLTGAVTVTSLAGPHNGTVGATTPNTGAFTTLAASGAVSGAGFTALFASPPAIGGTAAAAGAFTTLSATGAVSGAGFTNLFASPPAIGGTAAAAITGTIITANTRFQGPIGTGTPAAGAFSTLSATGAVSGAGFTSLFAAPPAIGTTTPAGGRFTFAHTANVAVAFSATAMTVDCNLSNVFSTTFTANVTTAPTMSNPKDGQTINWFITQDATGGRTMLWPSTFRWPGGTAGVLSTAANAVDLLVATYRGTPGAWYCTLLKGFA